MNFVTANGIKRHQTASSGIKRHQSTRCRRWKQTSRKRCIEWLLYGRGRSLLSCLATINDEQEQQPQQPQQRAYQRCSNESAIPSVEAVSATIVFIAQYFFRIFDFRVDHCWSTRCIHRADYTGTMQVIDLEYPFCLVKLIINFLAFAEALVHIVPCTIFATTLDKLTANLSQRSSPLMLSILG